ncbi:MAG: triose-phosphate isomerase family protein, partial [bacterium]
MRKLLIAGNWKMHKDRGGALALAANIVEKSGEEKRVDIAIFPPSVFLHSICDLAENTVVTVGAQNMHSEIEGAFTGEISSKMVLTSGGRMVILGHSERRHVFGETNDLICSKVKRAISDGLIPVLCIGEKLEEREAGKTEAVLSEQLSRTVSPAPDDNTLTFGATYSGTDGYDAGLDEVYIPPPDWIVDGWFDIEDSAYPHISQLRRDVKHPTPTVRWHLITRDETDGIARWNPAGLPEGEFRIDSLVDMKRDTQAYFGLNDTLLIEWTLPVIQHDSIHLSIGWNLVSLPVLPAGMTADEVF